MDWQPLWQQPLAGYLQPYQALFGDRRTATTFEQIVLGIIAAGSLVAQRIAAHAPKLAASKYGADRVLRLVHGDSTKRSPQLDANHLTESLRHAALEQLSQQPSDELWLIADGSDLRKPHARKMADLMKVRTLDGRLVPGYATINVIAQTPQHRYILYHHLFSSEADDFRSEPIEVRTALTTVHASLQQANIAARVCWILDRGFDAVAHWRTIWQQGEHLLVRLQHLDRLVRYQRSDGSWQSGKLQDAEAHLYKLARVATTLPQGGDGKPHVAYIDAEVAAVAVEVSGRDEQKVAWQQRCWLVRVVLLGQNHEPWWLLTDQPVLDEAAAVRAFTMYRQRWSVEDGFKFSKECLGWEEVQVLELAAVRLLVATAWVAAGFLYEMGVNLEQPEVVLLARLGGWDGRVQHKVGKIVLTRGLQRLLDKLATEAILAAHRTEYGQLPPRLAALLGEQQSLELCRDLMYKWDVCLHVPTLGVQDAQPHL